MRPTNEATAPDRPGSEPGPGLYLWPRTRLGRWSVGLLGAFAAFFGAMNVLVAAGQTGGERFSDNLLLAVPGALAAGCLLASGALGAVAVLRQRERALAVLLAVVLGLFAALFLAGEVLVPH